MSKGKKPKAEKPKGVVTPPPPKTTSTATAIGAGTAGTSLGIVVVWVLNTFAGADVPAEVGAAIGGSINFVIGLVLPQM